jgi:hypothetical protein
METIIQSSMEQQVPAPFRYEECVEHLADAVRKHDDGSLDEVAYLIGQLAVVIEI